MQHCVRGFKGIIWNIEWIGWLKCKWLNNMGQSTAELKDFQMDPERKSLSAHYHYHHVFQMSASLMA